MSAPPVPVLLTFDTEYDPDKSALEALDIDVPATHFLLGDYAERYPGMVRALAKRNTIGSHGLSHRRLPTLDRPALDRVFGRSKPLLENLAGRPAQWFRAPNLEVDDEALRAMHDAGFVYNSSTLERWREKSVLFDLPISTEDGADTAVSDYSLFHQLGMSDDQALAWLKARYAERESTGRPLVFLLHARIIGEHADVLHEFIAHVRQRGGRFMTADQYVESVNRRCPERFAVWIDFILGEHDPQVVADDLKSVGATDAFLMAKNTEGGRYYPVDGGSGPDRFGTALEALQQNGIRVHAWLPVNRDPRLARLHPDWAMQNIAGPRSSDWLSPSHPGFRRHLLETIEALVTRYPVDGLHLDYLRYPDISHDFSETTLAAFRDATGIRDASKQSLVAGDHYLPWMTWRNSRITAQTAAIHDLVRDLRGAEFELSAALIDEAAVSFRAADTFGQDYSGLAQYLDIISPMAYFTQDNEPAQLVNRTVWATRYVVGNTTVLTGLPAWEYRGTAAERAREFRRALQAAAPGSDGYAFYPYLHLFGRGAEQPAMPAEAIRELKSFIAAARSRDTCDEGASDAASQ